MQKHFALISETQITWKVSVTRELGRLLFECTLKAAATRWQRSAVSGPSNHLCHPDNSVKYVSQWVWSNLVISNKCFRPRFSSYTIRTPSDQPPQLTHWVCLDFMRSRHNLKPKVNWEKLSKVLLEPMDIFIVLLSFGGSPPLCVLKSGTRHIKVPKTTARGTFF